MAAWRVQGTARAGVLMSSLVVVLRVVWVVCVFSLHVQPGADRIPRLPAWMLRWMVTSRSKLVGRRTFGFVCLVTWVVRGRCACCR